jgi:succinate dehydrogenase/fumarate reductase flavoprotein subunit
VVDVNTHFEQNDFRLEALYPGSIINQRAFFMQDIMYVNIKVQREAKILELTQEKFQEIRDRYEKIGFSTKVLSYQNKILKQ